MRCGWPCRDVGSENMQWPCTYRIRLEGELASNWSDRLGGMDITIDWRESRGSVAVVLGPLKDQAALSVVLETLSELHLTLLSVEAV